MDLESIGPWGFIKFHILDYIIDLLFNEIFQQSLVVLVEKSWNMCEEVWEFLLIFHAIFFEELLPP